MGLRGHFHFQPIGQGLFYEGQIGKINVIYDCGSTELSRVDNIVSNYVNKLKRKTVDLLVLSHLHTDHVNGLDELFKHVKVRYVFLPYLLPFQRLLLASHEPEQAGDFYYNFLADPVSYLVDRGAEKVVLMAGGRRTGNEGDEFPHVDFQFDDEEDLNEEDINDEAIILPDSDDLFELISANEPELEELFQKNKIFCKDHSGYVLMRRKWVFRFFSSTSKKRLDKFIDSVKKEFKLTSLPDNKQLRKIILDSNNRKRLRKCYDTSYNGRLNDTSLMVFHGPVFNISLSITKQEDPLCTPYYRRANIQWEQNKPELKWGCLLTGDVNLKMVWTPFAIHFGNYFAHMTDLLIPHHGSKDNWKSQILDVTKDSKSWIVSAGLGNRYGHPNVDIVLEVLNRGKVLFWSNQLSKIDQEIYS